MIRILPLVLFLSFLSLPVRAETEPASGRLIAAYEGTGTFKEIEMGLQLTMKDQWYTYWRMPGDAGLAPTMNWEGSENVKDVKVFWPTPKRFTAFDMYSFGYDDTVIFPISVIPEKAGDAISLHLKLDIVVCHEICIPQTMILEKSIPAGGANKSMDRTLLTAARQSLPSYENTKELGIETAILGKDAITVVAEAKKGWQSDIDMFIESPDVVMTAVPEILPQDGNKTVIKVKAPEGVDLAKALFGKKVTIVLRNGEQSLEKYFSF